MYESVRSPFNFFDLGETIMKKILSILAALFCAVSPAMAEDSPFTGNVALTTDYVFRGISQSNEEPTVQGGMDWADAATGLYAGAWASGVDFEDATTEMDFYGGLSGTVDDISWDLGGIYYFYPGADDTLDYDFWELAASVGYDFDVLQATLSVNYSPDYFGSSGNAWYPSANVSVPLPYGLTADAGIGYQWIEDNESFGTDDYATWSLGLGYDLSGFNLGLKYIDTDLKEPSECADGCGARVVFTVSRSF
jgi:uncharacterized protein (TIGR02001 family)